MKIAIIFPGYGSQFVGMGKELYDESRLVQEYFEQAANCLDINFVKLCFASSDVELAKMDHAYTALFLVSSAFFAALKEAGIKADLVAGYNTGAYAALFAAQGITFPDGLYFLNKYATFYRDFLTTYDAQCIQVNGLNVNQVEGVTIKVSTQADPVSVGIYITESRCIITGPRSGTDQAQNQLQQYEDATVDSVDVAVGLHSPLMVPVAEQVKGYLPKIDLKELQIPLLTDTDAGLITSSEDVTDFVIQHIVSPLRLDKVLTSLSDYDVILEVCPAGFLTQLLKEQYPDKKILPINTPADIEQVKQFLHESAEKVENKDEL